MNLEFEEMEFSIGPAYIWMGICIGLLLVCLLLSTLICCFCCSQKKRQKKRQQSTTSNTSQRLGGRSRLPVHRPQDLEEEEQALAMTRPYARSFSTFSPKPLPAKSEAHVPPDFPELRAASARGASTSAPSLMLDGSFRSPHNH